MLEMMDTGRDLLSLQKHLERYHTLTAFLDQRTGLEVKTAQRHLPSAYLQRLTIGAAQTWRTRVNINNNNNNNNNNGNNKQTNS